MNPKNKKTPFQRYKEEEGLKRNIHSSLPLKSNSFSTD